MGKTKTKAIKLGSRIIKEDSLPYIIAEIGVNHEGSITNAKNLIEQAKEGGADAVKFQTYKAAKLASKNSPAYWDTTKEKTKSQYELFSKYDTFNEEEYIELSKFASKLKIDFLSTPFDIDSIQFLDQLIPFYKIASADITNLPFLREIGSKSKPVLISTGASNINEIDFALKILEESGANEIGILHCILNYPTKDKNANLNMIKSLRKIYPNNIIGYSDHTLPSNDMTCLLTSYLMGAVILEKHFTNNKLLPGNDHYHAMDKDDLKRFVNLVKKSKNLLGEKKIKQVIDSENISRLNARRSIVLKKKVDMNKKLKEEDLISKRPGTGISTIDWDKVIGLKVNKNLEEDHILQWDDLQSN